LPTAAPTPTTSAAYTAVMNAASAPYCSALLITMSMSYSRYFRIASAMAPFMQNSATLSRTLAAAELVRADGMIVSSTSTAAVANHFSWSRSSPADFTKRTISEITLSRIATGTSSCPSCSSAGTCPPP
jgi:low temperature requirement protein LtrA